LKGIFHIQVRLHKVESASAPNLSGSQIGRKRMGQHRSTN